MLDSIQWYLNLAACFITAIYIGFLTVPLCVLWKMYKNGLYPSMTISFESLQKLKQK